MKFDTLEQALAEVEKYIGEAKDKKDHAIKNSILPYLDALSYKAREAAGLDSLKNRYLDAANGLKGLCVKIKHPNPAKEFDSFMRIKDSFPEFTTP